jgi:hypothetical protein
LPGPRPPEIPLPQLKQCPNIAYPAVAVVHPLCYSCTLAASLAMGGPATALPALRRSTTDSAHWLLLEGPAANKAQNNCGMSWMQ